MLSIMHSAYSSIEPSSLTKMFLNSGPLMARMLWVVEIPKWFPTLPSLKSSPLAWFY